MRPLSVIGLLAVLTALVGCSAPKPKSTHTYPSGGQFKDDVRSNRETKAEQVPLKVHKLDGTEVDLASFRGKSNVVLVVVKGMPKFPGGAFCPGCLAQLNSLTANYEEFKQKKAEVVMVFPGPNESVPKFLADGKVDGKDGNLLIPFPLLSDTDLKAVRALGIDGDQATPATYILDKNGTVVFAYVAGADTTYDRPSVKALLEQLSKLNG